MTFTPLRASLALAAALALPAAPALAAPVSFDVTPVKFIVGLGYGTGVGQLDVSFVANPTQQLFSLDNGESKIFNFGSITFNETGTITAAETNNLNVFAVFSFADPLSGLRQVTAVGTATQGLIADPAIDLVIDWTPTVVDFGGGQFTINLNTVRFNQTGDSRTEFATITFSAPEPASLALAGLAFAGLGLARRRPLRAAPL